MEYWSAGPRRRCLPITPTLHNPNTPFCYGVCALLHGDDWLPRLDSHQDHRGQSSACDGLHHEARLSVSVSAWQAIGAPSRSSERDCHIGSARLRPDGLRRGSLRSPLRSERRLVAREGVAPPTSGCRPEMILFHHRAKVTCRAESRPAGGRRLAAGDGFAPPRSPSKGDVLLVRRPGNVLVEPEVVATSPGRIKSPMPVSCGFGS